MLDRMHPAELTLWEAEYRIRADEMDEARREAERKAKER